MRIKKTNVKQTKKICYYKRKKKSSCLLECANFFCQDVSFFWKSINYCCTLLLWWQNNRKYEAQSVSAGREGGGGCWETKTSGFSLLEGRVCLSASPPGSLLLSSAKNVILFYVSLGFSAAAAASRSGVPADRQALWKFDCNPSRSSLPPPPELVQLRERSLQLWQEICKYSFQNKQKKCMWADFFCTLVVL